MNEGAMMKRRIILISIAALLFSSCSLNNKNLQADPTLIPTSTPIAVLDLCTSENLMGEVRKVQDLVNTFQDIMYVANFSPQTELTIPILEMQAVRRDLQKLEVPDCENAVKIASINYMNSTISYLAYYMANGADEYVNTSIQTSQDLWQEVISEFNNLLSSVGLISDELPNIGNSLLPTSNIMIFVANNGTKRINVRNRPNLNADILAQFEPGMQAIGLERVESGDWLLINLDGVTGWVFTEMVTVSTDIEELPISAPFEE